MRVIGLLAISACNGVLGLGDVSSRDAPVDAPTRCPAPGVVPAYSTSITQFFVFDVPGCNEFQFDVVRSRAIATCADPLSCTQQIYEGPVGGPLTPALPTIYTTAKLDADGSRIYAYDGLTNQYEALRRDAGGWVLDATLPFTNAAGISTVARAGDEVHVLVSETDPIDVIRIHEWVGNNGTWTEQATYYTAASLGLTVLIYPTLDLAPDGLRLIVDAVGPGDTDGHMYYADRASLADQFGTAQPLAIPTVGDPFISDDCTQILFSGLQRVVYVSRQ